MFVLKRSWQDELQHHFANVIKQESQSLRNCNLNVDNAIFDRRMKDMTNCTDWRPQCCFLSAGRDWLVMTGGRHWFLSLWARIKSEPDWHLSSRWSALLSLLTLFLRSVLRSDDFQLQLWRFPEEVLQTSTLTTCLHILSSQRETGRS